MAPPAKDIRTPLGTHLQGRRTGLVINKSVRKDSEGFDDIDSFWNTGTPQSIASSSTPSPRDENENIVNSISGRTKDSVPNTSINLTEMKKGGVDMETEKSLQSSSHHSTSSASNINTTLDDGIGQGRESINSVESGASFGLDLSDTPSSLGGPSPYTRLSDATMGNQEENKNNKESLDSLPEKPEKDLNRKLSFKGKGKGNEEPTGNNVNEESNEDLENMQDTSFADFGGADELNMDMNMDMEFGGGEDLENTIPNDEMEINVGRDESTLPNEVDNSPKGSSHPETAVEQEEQAAEEKTEENKKKATKKPKKVKRQRRESMLTDRDEDARLRLDDMKASVNDDTDDMLEPAPRTKKIRLSEIYGRRQHDEEDFGNDNVDSDEGNGGRRRSKRKRMAPLKFWKNERPQFERDPEKGVPEVKALIVAAPTPAKRKRAPNNKTKRATKGKNPSEEDNEEGCSSSQATTKKGLRSIKPLDVEELIEENPNYVYMNVSSETQDRAHVWDEQNSMFQEKKVVSHMCTMREMKLPITHDRPEGRDGVGLAVQGFNRPQIDKSNIPGWISGHVVLPPMAIKDAEGVGLCSQIFFVAYGQPKSIEIALARADEPQFNELTAQRYLLSPGDNFYIPPNNVYRLENHSASEECKLFWTIVKPWTDNEGKEENQMEIPTKGKIHQTKQVKVAKVNNVKQRKIIEDKEDTSDMESDTAEEEEEEEEEEKQIHSRARVQTKTINKGRKSITSRGNGSNYNNKTRNNMVSKKEVPKTSKGKGRSVVIDTRKKAIQTYSSESSDEESEEEESVDEESEEEEESEEDVQEDVEIQVPRRKSMNKADIDNVYRIGDKTIHNFGAKSGASGRTAISVNGRIKHKFQR